MFSSVLRTKRSNRPHRRRCGGPALARLSLVFGALLVAFGCAADDNSGPSGVTTGVAESSPTPEPRTEPAPDDQIPVPEGTRDEIVYERLIGDGFSAAEAECLARSVSLDDLVSFDPAALIAVYTSCNVSTERLIELAGAR